MHRRAAEKPPISHSPPILPQCLRCCVCASFSRRQSVHPCPSALPRLASKCPRSARFFRHFVRFFRHFVRFWGVLGCFRCSFCRFLGCIRGVMVDFDLQIFGGVTRLAAARALPPWGAAGDLCAKDVLYAMKRRKNHAKTARKRPARRILAVFELSARQKCKNARQPAKMDAISERDPVA